VQSSDSVVSEGKGKEEQAHRMRSDNKITKEGKSVLKDSYLWMKHKAKFVIRLLKCSGVQWCDAQEWRLRTCMDKMMLMVKQGDWSPSACLLA
jgi:hypothetical protein